MPAFERKKQETHTKPKKKMMRQQRNRSLIFWMKMIFFYCINMFVLISSAPLSNPLTSDGEIGKILPDHFESKKFKSYHEFTPNQNYTLKVFDYDELPSCDLEFNLKWSHNVGSPIYSTPVIFPGATNIENKNIFVSTYFNNVELFEGDGTKPLGWPITFHNTIFQSSPLVFDIDGDGNTDIGVTDEKGNLYWIRVGQYGTYLDDYHIQIPKLKLRKDWMTQANTKDMNVHISLSRFDRRVDGLIPREWTNRTKTARLDPLSAPLSTKYIPESPKANPTGRRRLEEVPEPEPPTSLSESELGLGEIHDEDFEYGGLDIDHGEDYLPDPGEMQGEEEPPFLFQESANENEILPPEESPEFEHTYGYAQRFVRNGDDVFYSMRYGYGSMGDDSEYVSVDPHVLTTPAMADINGDGHMEIVFPVSYYFNKDTKPVDADGNPMDIDLDLYVASGLACWDMEMQEWKWTVHLDLTTAKSKFPAVVYSTPTIADLDGDDSLEVIVGTSVGMLYVFDGHSGFTRRFFPMQFHSIQAQIAVADILGGPHLEMIVVDMAGTIAVVNVEGDILWDQSLSGALPYTPTVADINGDGQLDIIVATLDDAKKSHIWVLSGDNGRVLEGFPVALPKSSAISGPIIIADLDISSEYENPIDNREFSTFQSLLDHDGLPLGGAGIKKFQQKKTVHGNPVEFKYSKTKNNENNNSSKSSLFDEKIAGFKSFRSPHLLIPTFQGRVYILQFHHSVLEDPVISLTTTTKANPSKFCLQRIEVDGSMKTSPLLDDVTNDGYLDIILTSLNGEIAIYETTIPFHSSNIWNSFPKDHGKSFTFGDISISISNEDKLKLKKFEYANGQELSIRFTITDRRCLQKPCTLDEYHISIMKNSNHPEDIIWKADYTEPGDYQATIPLDGPEKSIYYFILSSKHGKYAEDFVTVTISTRFYVWLKYLLFFPMFLFSSITLLKVTEYL